jgi:hypothetical protein
MPLKPKSYALNEKADTKEARRGEQRKEMRIMEREVGVQLFPRSKNGKRGKWDARGERGREEKEREREMEMEMKEEEERRRHDRDNCMSPVLSRLSGGWFCLGGRGPEGMKQEESWHRIHLQYCQDGM